MFDYKYVLLTLIFSISCYSNDLNYDYLKRVDIDLYQQLMKIENCRQTKKSVAECQQLLNLNASSKTSAVGETAKSSSKQNTKATKWWLSSSYEQKEQSGKWQNAVLTSLSLDEMRGNIAGSQYSMNLDYYSRYDNWTNLISLAYAKEYLKQSGTLALNTKNQLLSYNGRLDLDKSWFTQLGYAWERDTSLALDKNKTYYLGIGNHLLNTDTLILTGFTALGDKTEFFSTENSIATGLDKFNYDLAYAFQRLKWKLSKELTLSQSIEVYYSLDELADFDYAQISDEINPACIDTLVTDASYCIVKYENRNKIEFILGLEYKLNQYFSLAYELNYEKESAPFITDSAHNSTHSLSITAQFQ